MKYPALIVFLALAVAPLAEAADATAPAKAPQAASPAQAQPAPGGDAAVYANIEVPPRIVEEMGKLVEAAVQGAAQPLQTSDDFTPYGVVQTRDGKLHMVRWGKPNPPPAMELFRQIFIALRSEARKDEVVGAVTVAPTSAPTTDGKERVALIRAEVDHREGAPRIVLIPYKRIDGKLELGTPIYQPGINAVFDHSKQLAAQAQPADKKVANTKGATKAGDKSAAKPGAKPAAKTP